MKTFSSTIGATLTILGVLVALAAPLALVGCPPQQDAAPPRTPASTAR